MNASNKLTYKKLEEYVDARAPSEEDLKAAEADDATITAYNPERLRQFLEGKITLGELEDIQKDTQYEMAELGFRFLNEGKLDKAKTVFLGLLALDPYDAYFHSSYAALLLMEKDVDAAITHYTRALEINPFSLQALTGRGEAYVMQGDLDAAATDLQKVLDEDPESNQEPTQRARIVIAEVLRQAKEAEGSDPGT